jgi:hypothetical protein
MKRTILFLMALFLTFALQAQTNKFISDLTPGSLISRLTAEELSTINSLGLTGTIDARDFKTIRDKMPNLTVIDIYEVTIAEYTGKEGTSLLAGEPVQDITYPANTIPDGAFYEGAYFNENKNLSYVYLPGSITAIGNSAFYQCNNLSSIWIPEIVTSIGYQAFKYCTSLKSISLPPYVTQIGDEAFSDCTGLTSIMVNSKNPVELTSTNVFNGVDKSTCSLHVPIRSLSLYQSTDVWKDFLNIIARPQPYYLTIKNLTPGTLINRMDSYELKNTKGIYLEGTIDARDFKTMRDSMPTLERVDLNHITILEYTGKEGPDQRDENNPIVTYPANTIPNFAFQKCDSLLSVQLPFSLKSIGVAAFKICKKLQGVSIYNPVTSIEREAFAYCSELSSLSLPSTLINIGTHAFTYCGNLKEINLPASITSLGNGIFRSCTQLNSIMIPASVTLIPDSTFYGCSGLKSIYISKSVKTLGINSFSYCDSLKSIIIPNSVASIKSGAFSNCKQLKSVILPASVTSIGDSIFYSCTQLTSITANSKAPFTLPSSDVFYGVDKTACTLYVSTESLNTYQSADVWKDFSKVVAIQRSTNKTITDITPGSLITRLTSEELNAIDTLTLMGTIDARDFTIMRDSMPKLTVVDISAVTIDKYFGKLGPRGQWPVEYPENSTPDEAFKYKFSLTKVILSNKIHSLGFGSFQYCSNLISVNIPSSVTSISNGAFDGCASLTSITIPENITSIGAGAFSSCVKLKGVSIPVSVNRIDGGAFSGCTSLTSITIPSSVTSIGANVFWGCSGIRQIAIPASVNKIGNCAFSESSALIKVDSENKNYLSIDGVLFNKNQTILFYCPNSKSGNYTVPNTVKTIKNDAFSKCSRLTYVSIPASVDSIGIRAFFYCTEISRIVMPSTLKYIGDGAFDSCYALASFEIPDSITEINGHTFENCRTLKSIFIPNSVKSIGNYSFSNCWELKSVTFSNSLDTIIGEYAFSGGCKLSSFTIPNSVKTIKKGAFSSSCNLSSVTIPANVTKMEDAIFANCQKLTKIYAYPTVPVKLPSFKVFEYVDKSACTLYVPVGSLELYKTAAVWQDFLKMEGVFPVSVERNKSNLVTVSPNPAKDVINIANSTGKVSIFNNNGRLVKTQSLKYTSSINISSLISGMYVLVVDGKSFKILKE